MVTNNINDGNDANPKSGLSNPGLRDLPPCMFSNCPYPTHLFIKYLKIIFKGITFIWYIVTVGNNSYWTTGTENDLK